MRQHLVRKICCCFPHTLHKSEDGHGACDQFDSQGRKATSTNLSAAFFHGDIDARIIKMEQANWLLESKEFKGWRDGSLETL
jgi:hypothetical protein